MKILFCSLFFLSIQFVIGQKTEYLIYESDTIRLIIDEQEEFVEGIGHQSPIGIDGEEYEIDQINYWQIINDSLFEVRLFNTDMSFRIFQHNTTTTLYCPDGELLQDYGLTQIYIKEKGLIIKNGILTGIKTYDNSLSVLSPYAKMDSVFYNYLNTNIDHSNLDIENCTRVYLRIRNKNKEGVIQSVDILRGCNENINQELIQVVEKIPQWSIIYLHGTETDFCNIVTIELEKIISTTR